MERTHFEWCKEERPKQAKTMSTEMTWKKTRNDKEAKKTTEKFQNSLQRLTIELHRASLGWCTGTLLSFSKPFHHCSAIQLWGVWRQFLLRHSLIRHLFLILVFSPVDLYYRRQLEEKNIDKWTCLRDSLLHWHWNVIYYSIQTTWFLANRSITSSGSIFPAMLRWIDRVPCSPFSLSAPKRVRRNVLGRRCA